MKIIFFGDSITDMGRYRDCDTVIDSYGYGFVQQIAANLTLKNPEKYQILNRGVGGDRVVDLYARIKKDVWNHKPDVLSILVGANDVGHEIAAQNGVDIKRYEKIYRMMLDDTLERVKDIKIILCQPFIFAPLDEQNPNPYAEIWEYAKVVEKIAKDYNLPFVELQKYLDEAAKKTSSKNILSDNCHPNPAGAKIIADRWLEVFKKEVDI